MSYSSAHSVIPRGPIDDGSLIRVKLVLNSGITCHLDKGINTEMLRGIRGNSGVGMMRAMCQEPCYCLPGK